MLIIYSQQTLSKNRILLSSHEYCQGLTQEGKILINQQQILLTEQAKRVHNYLHGENNYLNQFLSNRDQDAFQQQLIFQSLPIAIMVILSIISWIYYVIKLKSISIQQCCFNINSSIQFKKITLLTISVMIFITSMVGIYLTFQVSQGIDQMRCSLITLLDETKDGSVQNGVKWIGISNIYPKIIDLKTKLKLSTKSIDEVLQISNTNFLSSDVPYLFEQNQLIYTNNKDETLFNPSQQGGSNIVPLGLTTYLLNSSNLLNQMFQNTIQIIQEKLLDLIDNTKLLSQKQTQFHEEIVSSIPLIQNLHHNITQLQNSMDSNLKQIDLAIQIIDGGFYAYFILTTLIGILPANLIYKILNQQKSENISKLNLLWNLTALFTLIGFLFSLILYPLSIITLDFSDIVFKMTSDKSQFSNYPNLISKSITDKIEVCFYGQGEMQKSFDLQNLFDQLSIIDSKFLEFQQISDMNNKEKYIDIEKNLEYIDKQINQYKSFKIGYPAVFGEQNQPISDSNYNDDRNPIIALQNLNVMTGSNNCLGFNDEFVFDFMKCPNGYTIWSGFKGSDNSQLNKQYCIKISNFSSTNVFERYNLCQKKQQILNSFVNLKLWDEDKSKKYEEVVGIEFNSGSTLQGIKSSSKSLNVKIQLLYSQLKNLQKQIDPLTKAVTSNTDGFIIGLNCQFLARNTKNMLDSIQFGFYAPFYGLTIIMIIQSLSLFVITYVTQHFAMKLNLEDQELKRQFQIYQDYEMIHFSPNRKGGMEDQQSKYLNDFKQENIKPSKAQLDKAEIKLMKQIVQLEIETKDMLTSQI